MTVSIGFFYASGEVFRTKSLPFLHVALCEVQSCVRHSARLLPRICWSFARRMWTPTQLGQILLCQQHVDVATPEIRSLPGSSEFSKALTLLRRGTRFWAAPRVDGASETQFLSSFHDIEQLSPDWEDEQNLRHFRMFRSSGGRPTLGYVAYAQSDLDSNAPGSKK